MPAQRRRNAGSRPGAIAATERLAFPRAFYYWLGGAVVAAMLAGLAVSWESLFPVADDRLVTVYRRHGCPCYRAWADHLEAQGFVVRVFELDRLEPTRARWGNTVDKPGCHFAVAGGYFIEGHVEAQDIKKLLAEKPPGRGIVIPGGPKGLPGLQPATFVDPYQVWIVGDDGRAAVWLRHAGSPRTSEPAASQ